MRREEIPQLLIIWSVLCVALGFILALCITDGWVAQARRDALNAAKQNDQFQQYENQEREIELKAIDQIRQLKQPDCVEDVK